MIRYWTRIALCACASLIVLGMPAITRADEDDSPAGREARWKDIEKAIFGDRLATPDESIIKLDAPERAEDPALVSISITLSDKMPVKGLYLVIDDNPAPVAAHYIFGPASDSHVIRMRVRVNSYTNMHAVAELANGQLVDSVKFVKASGGCSAPIGMTDEEAMKDMGEMRLKFAQTAAPGKPSEATLMVRHPMFNGMQMDPITRGYTPALYIRSIKVSVGDKLVFNMSASISLAMNPVIYFGLLPQTGQPVTVSVEDTGDGRWKNSFPLPAAIN